MCYYKVISVSQQSAIILLSPTDSCSALWNDTVKIILITTSDRPLDTGRQLLRFFTSLLPKVNLFHSVLSTLPVDHNFLTFPVSIGHITDCRCPS